MAALKVPLGGGKVTSGCRCCGEVFTSLGGFDKHWAGWKQRDGKCRPPAEVGLIQSANGRWHFPGRDDDPDTNDEFL